MKRRRVALEKGQILDAQHIANQLKLARSEARRLRGDFEASLRQRFTAELAVLVARGLLDLASHQQVVQAFDKAVKT